MCNVSANVSDLHETLQSLTTISSPKAIQRRTRIRFLNRVLVVGSLRFFPSSFFHILLHIVVIADGNEEHTDNDNVAVDQDTKRITSIPSKRYAMYEADILCRSFVS